VTNLLAEIQAEFQLAYLFISHDLSLAAELADRVATVYAGKIVEIADVQTIFRAQTHPYTVGLVITSPPLIHSIGVAMANNRTAFFLKKGAPLPARGRDIHRTAFPVQAGQKGAAIKILRSQAVVRHPDMVWYTIYGTKGFIENGRSGGWEAARFTSNSRSRESTLRRSTRSATLR
jgi:ABC-type sugar transport system ATPase subunit